MKKFLLSSFVVFFSILITIFIFEKFLIWENYYLPFSNPTKISIKDITYTFLFDKPIDETKKQVYVIGDSFTEGASCAHEKKNLTSHLNEQLNQYNYQIINLGSSGKSLPNYIDFIHHFKITPNDKVILILYDNDIGFSDEMCSISLRHKKDIDLFSPNQCEQIVSKEINVDANNNFLRQINNYLKKYLTYKMIKEAVWQFSFFRKLMYRSELQNLWINFESEENKYIIEAIKYIKSVVFSNKGEFYLTYFPNVNNISNNDFRHGLWKKFLSYIKEVLRLFLSIHLPIILSVSPWVSADLGVVGYISAVSKKFIP